MQAKPINFTFQNDPSDAFFSRQMMREEGYSDDNHLTFIELGITNACNLKCTYCGEFENPIYASRFATTRDVTPIIYALDKLDTLRILSITGGEPLISKQIIKNIIIPILDFANSKGIYTQINSNLVIPEDHLELIDGKVSILHTSFNFVDAETFSDITLPSKKLTDKDKDNLFEQLCGNIKNLSRTDISVTAETLMFSSTFPHLVEINHLLAKLNVQRQELQVPFPTKNPVFDIPTMDELTENLVQLIEMRDSSLHIQIDCAPVWPCIADNRNQEILEMIANESNVITRSCPDGRSRMNLNLDGEVRITDFAETGPVGNIFETDLNTIFNHWKETDLYKKYNCSCEQQCLGPCILLANAYYPEWPPVEKQQPSNTQDTVIFPYPVL